MVLAILRLCIAGSSEAWTYSKPASKVNNSPNSPYNPCASIMMEARFNIASRCMFVYMAAGGRIGVQESERAQKVWAWLQDLDKTNPTFTNIVFKTYLERLGSITLTTLVLHDCPPDSLIDLGLVAIITLITMITLQQVLINGYGLL